MNENESYVKLFRKFEKWEWYTDVNTKVVFLHCLIKANWKDGKFRGVDIKRGSFLTSNEKLARECGLTVQNIKTAISHLQSTNELTKSKILNGTLITVLNYDLYQQVNQQLTNELNNDQPTTNQRLTTIEEYKELKELKEVNKKNKYGSYKHVLLTQTEYNKLLKDYANAEECITFLDEYIEMKGYKAKSHYLAIKKWVVDAVIEQSIKNKSKKVDVLPAYHTRERNSNDNSEYDPNDFKALQSK